MPIRMWQVGGCKKTKYTEQYHDSGTTVYCNDRMSVISGVFKGIYAKGNISVFELGYVSGMGTYRISVDHEHRTGIHNEEPYMAKNIVLRGRYGMAILLSELSVLNYRYVASICTL